MISAEIAVSGYILSPPELPEIPLRIEIPTKQLGILAQMAKCIAEARESLKRQGDKFEALFQLVVKRADINPEEIERMAESLLAGQQTHAPAIIAAAETLDEHKLTLRQSNDSFLNGPVLRLTEDAIDICRTWLELYQNLHIQLIKLASDRRAETEQGSPIFSDASAAESYLRRVLVE
jgi:hypothetical protein